MDINCHNLFFVVESNFVTTEKSDQRWAHTELPFFFRGPYRTTGLGTFAQPPSMMIMGLYARIRSRPWMWAEKGYHSASAAYDGTGNVYIPLSAAALPVTCSSLQTSSTSSQCSTACYTRSVSRFLSLLVATSLLSGSAVQVFP